jgi:hypothetical protein
MRTRTFRRAVAASVVLHVGLAVVLIVVGRWAAPRLAPAPALDTRVPDAVRITPAEVEVPTSDVAVTPAQGADAPRSADPAPPAEVHRPPTITAVPRPLPPELIALMRKPRAVPVGGLVTEVPVTPTPQAIRPPQPAPAGPLRPVAHATTDPQPGDGDGPPVHGALPPLAAVVYVLDASGSMGEWGKLERAKRALVGTLRRQPETVRFQVVVYDRAAVVPLPAPVGGMVYATPTNVDRIGPMLRTVSAAGRSNHAAGLAKALELRPDYVLILTDADDLSAATFRGLLSRAGKPMTVCVAKVTAEGVAAPVALR